MKAYRIALHIGLPKTATTSLQKNVLHAAHENGDINFLGRSGVIFEKGYFYPFESIFSQLGESPLSENKVVALRKKLERSLDVGKLNVISEESLSLTHGFHYVRLENLKRILSPFDVKVLISLRSPVDFFYSYYIELYPTTFVHMKSLDSLEKFALAVLTNPSNQDFDIVCLDRFLTHLRMLFPDLSALLFEDIKQDRDQYIKGISEFFGLEQSFIQEHFFVKEQNKGVRGESGKLSRKVSLLENFQALKSLLFGKSSLHRLKQFKRLYSIYKKFLFWLNDRSFSDAIEHKPLGQDKLDSLKSCLFLKKNWAGVLNLDIKKLVKYNYMQFEKQHSHVTPEVSLCLITYNHEKYIESALNSALNQNFQNLEVVISDDSSPDKTFQQIEACLEVESIVPVKVISQTVNMGINAHINQATKKCTGRLVVIASGDDISMPNRVERIVEEWEHGAVGIFSNAEVIDSRGRPCGLFMHQGYKHLTSWKDMVALGGHGAWGCSFAWDRKICEVFGPIPVNILGEDASIPFRCALLGKVAYIDEPLVQYRDHGKNISFWAQRKNVSGKALKDLGKEVIKFDLVMYQNWRKDIQVAYAAGYLTEGDVEWAKTILQLHEETHESQLEVLNVSYNQVFLLLFRILYRKGFSKDGVLWFKRVLSTFLYYRVPLLFKLVQFVRKS
ncbi:glycosyltransferase [Ghiorsea bivora]|uniref:glycosyltransferase n=1 Tax=Ghiorsea bivora TaxID=1485545 RepID=UPI001E3D0311|nr:glycosyltransferase [Ghiorsea bivora]